MYNDGGVTDNLWTGFYDAVEGAYEYPSAHQNLIVRFPTWYLSADDGDFTTDSVTITSEVCSSEDITIGNAPAQVFSATMLNPDGLMESCTWGDGAVYLGVVTAEASADTHSGWMACVSYNSHDYGFTANGTAYYDSTSQAIGGEPKAIVVKQDGTAEFYTSTGAYKYDGGFSSITPDAFVAAKYANYDDPLGIILDTNNCPSIINNVSAGTKTTITYIPMGIFDFSNVDAFGITFNVEAYDGMVKFDADATAWVEALDFTTPLTISDLITAIATEVGFTPIVSGYAVNTSLSFSENPITNYASTYRQVLKWLAEAIGCNVRISRTGQLVFWVFGSSVATITPDTIISNTRTKNRYTIPQMTRVVCYNTVGAGYESGTSGPPYYVIANPFIDPSAGMTPVTNLLSIVSNIPTYYPTTISVACADPRIDVGEYITVTATDGTSYVMPIMRQTLSWNGTCKASYIATGNQTRDIPAAMTGSDLSSVVNSNPAAVVNKIMAKGLTVYDSSNNVLFSAIGDDHRVEIAGFDVEDDRFSNYVIEESTLYPGYYDTYDTEITNRQFKTGVSVNSKASDNTMFYRIYRSVYGGEALSLSMNAPNDPDDPGHNEQLSMGPNQLWIRYNNTDELTFLNSGTGPKIFLVEPPYSLTLTASGPTPTTVSDSESVTSNANWHTVKDFTISAPGTYLISIHANFPSNATGRRQMVLSTSQDSSSAVARRFMESKNAVNGTATYLNLTAVVVVPSSTTYYINVQQNSGSSLSVTWEYSYVRLA